MCSNTYVFTHVFTHGRNTRVNTRVRCGVARVPHLGASLATAVTAGGFLLCCATMYSCYRCRRPLQRSRGAKRMRRRRLDDDELYTLDNDIDDF